MKRVRVLVIFEEVNDSQRVINSTRATKFGAVTTEHYGSPERIAQKLSDCVHETVSTYFPEFLTPNLLKESE